MARVRCGKWLLGGVALTLGVSLAATPTHAQADGAGDAPRSNGPTGRQVSNDRLTVLSFENVTVEDIVPFIVESTGKVVLPRSEIMSRRITIVNNREIPQSFAVDLVFFALQQEGIGVVETDNLIILRDIAEIDRQDVPVIGPETSVLGRTDFGSVAEKVYRLEHQSAENLEEVLEDAVPDFATIAFDELSNQVVVRGNVSLLQRMERLIESLDRPSAASLRSRTYRMRFADAEEIAENIRELFEDDEADASGNAQQNFRRFMRNRGGGDEDASASTSANLRVTANTQQNSVTVLAEPGVLDQVTRLVEDVWDQPLPEEAVIPRIYDLEHTDPVRVATLLEGLFGSGTSGGGQQGGQGGPSEAQGAGRLSGQFTFQPLAEAGRLVVVAKSPDNLSVIDAIIKDLDRPQDVGLPEVIALKHADAEELAEELNAILAEAGTLAQVPRTERGLSESASGASPFAGGGNEETQTEDSVEFITFWWQQSRPATEERETSNLVGRLRIVPVLRQNAVMVLSPPEYRASIRKLIEGLDQPGRQVLVTAVIAEVALEDALSLGLRFSSDTIQTEFTDNTLSIGTTTTAQSDNLFDNLFDTSVLNANADLNLVLQALDQDSAVNILSEPRIFTSDNQEAVFFDGQDVPIVTDTQLTTEGTFNTTREYRAVGIRLSARPRITADGNVDLRVNLELSSIAPGQALTDFVIIDRRETTTELIVRDGQTVVISGILRSEESDVTRKVPLLGDIPILGALFTSTDRSTTNTELVAFITPQVVESERDLDEVNQPFRERLESLRENLDEPGENDDDSATSDAPTGPTE